MSSALATDQGCASDAEKQQVPIEHDNGHGQEKRHGRLVSMLKVDDGEVYEGQPEEERPRWYQRLLDFGVEENGIRPVPVEGRTDRRYYSLFTVIFTGLMCLLPLPTGMLATLSFGMSLRDSALVIVFFSLLTVVPPAFMGVGGCQTGMRQLVQARYSFGLYLATVPLLLNAATVTGFSLVSAIVGGQALAAVSRRASLVIGPHQNLGSWDSRGPVFPHISKSGETQAKEKRSKQKNRKRRD